MAIERDSRDGVKPADKEYYRGYAEGVRIERAFCIKMIEACIKLRKKRSDQEEAFSALRQAIAMITGVETTETKKYKQFTKEEDDIIRLLYPTGNTKEIAKKLHRNPKCINARAEKLGVKKDPETRRKLMIEWGANTRFGMNGRVNRTPCQKKKGSTRVLGGRLQVRVSETSHAEPSDWKYVHRLVWEKHNGKIPDGYVVRFKDGNPSNIDISNLELMSRNDHLKEVHEKYKNIAPITRAINKLNKMIEEKEKDGK